MRKLFVIGMLLFAGLAWAQCDPSTGAQCDGPATLPSGMLISGVGTTIDTTFPSQPSANIYTVTSGDPVSLQNTLNTAAANCGTTGAIVNVPVATYSTATYFKLPLVVNCTTGWLVIQSGNVSSLPTQGKRVTTADLANMPTITSTGNNAVFAIPDNSASPPKNIRLVGLNIVSSYPSASGKINALIHAGEACAIVGGGGCSFTSVSSYASHVTIDRCYVHGADINASTLHGIRYTASYMAVVDSVVTDIHDISTSPGQSTGISSDFSYGPVKIDNNTIQSMTEGVMFGGTDPPNSGQVTSNIQITNNLISRPSSWDSVTAITTNQRNWIECKNCTKMLVQGNVFDRNWDNSLSAAFQFTPRNSNGTCTWCKIEDVTIRYNKGSNFGDLISILGANGNTGGGSLGPELPTKRVSMHDNVFEGMDKATYGGNGRWIQLNDGDASATGCSGTANTAPCQVSDITITHNTFAGGEASTKSSTFITLAGVPLSTDKSYSITITNNIAPAGAFLIGNDAGTVHPLTGVFNAYASSYTFDTNVITNITGAGFSGTDFPSPICNFSTTGTSCSASNPGLAASMSAVGFVNYNSGSGGDYRLCQLSSVPSGCSSASSYWIKGGDLLTPGASVEAVTQMIAKATAGQPVIPASMHVSGRHGFETLYSVPLSFPTHTFTEINFPGYFKSNVGDGAGPSQTHVSVSGGVDAFWDLPYDPRASYNLGGTDGGMLSKDYACDGLGSCTGTDQKDWIGTVTTYECNNVRCVVQYRWPFTNGTVGSLTAVPNLFGTDTYTFYRGGIINDRWAFDNSTGTSIGLTLLQYNMNNSWNSFAGECAITSGGTPGAFPACYAPTQSRGCADDYWQTHSSPSTPSPWGWVVKDPTAILPANYMLHSTTTGTVTAPNFNGTLGQTYYLSQATNTFPVAAEFLTIIDPSDFNTIFYFPYKGAFLGGIRSKLEIPTHPVSIPNNGNDSLVRTSRMVAGSNGIHNATGADPWATEWGTPPTPTINAGGGSGIGFDYGGRTTGGGNWAITAGAGPKVDITTTGVMHSPVFLISGWDNSLPSTITVGGVTKYKDVDFVAVNTDATHLLLQIVGAPSVDPTGTPVSPNTTLSSSTQIVINSGTPQNPTTINGGRTIPGGSVIH